MRERARQAPRRLQPRHCPRVAPPDRDRVKVCEREIMSKRESKRAPHPFDLVTERAREREREQDKGRARH